MLNGVRGKLGLCPEFEKGLDLESRGFDLYVCVRDDSSFVNHRCWGQADPDVLKV